MAKRDRETEPTQATDYKVTDRRLFTADGELRPGRAEDEERPETSGRDVTAGGSPSAAGFQRRPVEEPEGVDFTMLINAMAEPALLFLGEIAHPSSDGPQVDLERARMQIDMLDLLRVKCRGNLTPEEEGLLERILYQLRMLYVAKANQPIQR